MPHWSERQYITPDLTSHIRAPTYLIPIVNNYLVMFQFALLRYLLVFPNRSLAHEDEWNKQVLPP